MDELFGIPLTRIMISLLVLMTGAFAVIAWIAWRNPLLARMGLRNIVRRRAQTALIVIGLMLSTLIMSAAFSTGDTVGYSITNEIYRSLGEADILVAFDNDGDDLLQRNTLTDEDLLAIRNQFDNDSDIDGITGILSDVLPALNPRTRLSEPLASLAGVDPTTVDDFHGILDIDGNLLSASALNGNAFITALLAEELGSRSTDVVTVLVNNESYDLQVIEVVRDNALTDSRPEGARPGGVVLHIDLARELTKRPGELDVIVISVTGGVRDTLDLIGPVEKRLDNYLERSEIPARVVFTKEDSVVIGETVGSIFVTFFLIFGLFSIAAGVMLIFLIFIMLAAERRSEMGMARAIGMKRLQLTETFMAEGMSYNVGSAAVGALLGLGVAFLLVFVMGQIFSAFGLSISFRVNPQGLVIAYGLGVILTFITVSFSSYRAANVNIVRAIRDLPEPQPLRGSNRSITSLLTAAVGALWYLIWLAIIAAFVITGVLLFGITLGTYGVSLIPIALIVSWFIFGARASSRPLSLTRGWRRMIYLLWWIFFTICALIAPITWFLFRTKAWADQKRNAGGWATIMLILGVILIYFGGWQTHFLFTYTTGATISVLAIAMLTVYFGLSSRIAFTIAGLALIWYWLLPLPFSMLFESGHELGDPIHGLLSLVGLDPQPGERNIEMFFFSGISITAAATLVVIFNADVILSIVSALGRIFGGIAPAVRTAIAYPLAAKVRTGMTLAMFAIVVFSLVVMAFMNFNFTQLFLGQDARAGFDIVVDANRNNRISNLQTVLSDEGYDVDSNIDGVGTLISATATFRERHTNGNFNGYQLQGMDDEFIDLARLPLLARATGYESDKAVMDALRTDPKVAIVDASRLPSDGFGNFRGTNRFELSVTQSYLEDREWAPIPILARNVLTSEIVDLNIIAVIEPQVTHILPDFFAVFVNQSVITNYFNGGQEETFLVTTKSKSTDETLDISKGIESTLIANGVQATSIGALIDDATEQSRAFQMLFEGFMGLGLIVGIAALGVIAFRTVVERRQQIGMLRAIGYSRNLIGLSFFLESSFIAITGISMGVLLGYAHSYNILTSPTFTDGVDIQFQVPWLRLAIIASIAYGASALMTVIPSRSASRVVPAEALRYE